jgi:hypothetical protein
MLCKVLKLTNGDTLIGNVVEESRGFIEVHRPMRVVVVPKNDYTYSLSFTKWDPLMNYSIPARIFKQSIVSVAEATTEIIKVYGEAYEEFDLEIEPDTEIDDENQSEDRMSEIKEEIDRMRVAMTSSNNHILH